MIRQLVENLVTGEQSEGLALGRAHRNKAKTPVLRRLCSL
jgi:hypothetical protein